MKTYSTISLSDKKLQEKFRIVGKKIFGLLERAIEAAVKDFIKKYEKR